MTKKMKNRYLFRYLALAFIFSFFFLIVFSMNSFLYPLNTWEDANIFLTIGRAIMNGKVLYRDIVDQKGPLLFFIYGLFSLPFESSFFGIFIVEIILMTLFIFLFDKTLYFLFRKRWTFVFTLLAGILIYTSASYRGGGTAESFALPIIMLCIYHFFYYRDGKKIPYHFYILHAFFFTVLFFIKMTLIGIYIPFFLYFLYRSFTQSGKKAGFLSMGLCVCTALLTFLPIFLYFYLQNAISDFIEVYFLMNIVYASSSTVPIYIRIFHPFLTFFGETKNLLFAVTLVMAILDYFFRAKRDKKEKIWMLLFLLSGYFTVYLGAFSAAYYGLYFAPFYILGAIDLCGRYQKKKVEYRLLNLTMFAISISAFVICDVPHYITKQKNSYVAYEFYNIMKSDYPNPSFLNYHSLDIGIHNVSNTLPTYKYYFTMLFDHDQYKAQYEEQDQLVRSQAIDFLVGFVYTEKGMEAFLEQHPLMNQYYMEIKIHVEKDKTYFLYARRMLVDFPK